MNGLPSGNGTLTMKNGDVYVGHFEDGKLNGHGKLTYSRNNEYQRERHGSKV